MSNRKRTAFFMFCPGRTQLSTFTGVWVLKAPHKPCRHCQRLHRRDIISTKSGPLGFNLCQDSRNLDQLWLNFAELWPSLAEPLPLSLNIHLICAYLSPTSTSLTRARRISNQIRPNSIKFDLIRPRCGKIWPSVCRTRSTCSPDVGHLGPASAGFEARQGADGTRPSGGLVCGTILLQAGPQKIGTR